jgi:hypothetical protein
MLYFFIAFAGGFCLLTLLLTVFFKAGKKPRRQSLTDRELVNTLGDEGLIRLYEQAETDNEREGIVEFVKEKLTTQITGGPTLFDNMPAGAFNAAEVAQPETAAQTTSKTAAQATPDTIARAIPGTITQRMPEAVAQTLVQVSPETLEQPVVQDSPKMTEQAKEQRQSALPNNERRQIAAMLTAMSGEEQEDISTRTSQTQTHELPLDKVDWAAIEEALEKKREEDARIMAHNKLIQDVFSKIQGVENRVMGEMQDNKSK